MYAHACKAGYEGVVSKVRDSTYASGRGNNDFRLFQQCLPGADLNALTR